MKNKLYRLLIVVLCLSTFGGTPRKAAAQTVPLQSTEVSFVPGQMIVIFRKGFDRDRQAEISTSIAQSLSGKILGMRDGAVLMGVDENIDIPSFTAGFSKNIQSINPDIKASLGSIAYTQPNYIFFNPPPPEPGDPGDVTPHVPLPNDEEEVADPVQLKKAKSDPILPTYPQDPFLYGAWGWWNTSTDVVWQDKTASPMICLLDTGVDADHPDLVGRIVNGKDVVNNDAVPDDDNGHGTHVAGILAAKSNNKLGIPGISNSKILAVKVLDSVGQGDSWHVSYGINYCANNPDVKIINMSLGTNLSFGGRGTVDELMYNALDRAINAKGKLVVVAAGNGSTSDFTFPAAWAGDFVCKDGYSYTPPFATCRPETGDPFPNTISDGLISVGASRSGWSTAYDFNDDDYLWVDTNGNFSQDGFELYYLPWCSAYFSNFGAWVNIVAPGENITSTVPVSYPFYQQYNPYLNADPDGDGYDTWSGTSMAAPFVSAIAARVWSIGNSLFGTTPTNKLVKSRLISTGSSVITAVDPNVSPIYEGYGAFFGGEAPYCWPNASQGTLYDMSNTHMLNAADAMNRSTVYAYIYNATNNLPLKGATVGAYIGTTAKSRALMNSNVSPFAILPNLTRGKTYAIKVNKAGFTDGQVIISKLFIDPGDYAYISDPSISVSIPPMGKIHGVLDWTINSSANEIDLYAWIPEVSRPGGGGIIGYSLNLPSFLGSGKLVADPFARWNIDSFYSFDWARAETITIMPRPSFTPTTAYYNKTNSDFYDFIAHDFSPGAINDNQIYFRLWVDGKIRATVHKTTTCDTNGPDNILYTADDERWWEPGYLWKDKFIVWNVCGKGDTYGNGGLWPYTFAGSDQLQLRSAP